MQRNLFYLWADAELYCIKHALSFGRIHVRSIDERKTFKRIKFDRFGLRRVFSLGPRYEVV